MGYSISSSGAALGAATRSMASVAPTAGVIRYKGSAAKLLAPDGGTKLTLSRGQRYGLVFDTRFRVGGRTGLMLYRVASGSASALVPIGFGPLTDFVRANRSLPLVVGAPPVVMARDAVAVLPAGWLSESGISARKAAESEAATARPRWTPPESGLVVTMPQCRGDSDRDGKPLYGKGWTLYSEDLDWNATIDPILRSSNAVVMWGKGREPWRDKLYSARTNDTAVIIRSCFPHSRGFTLYDPPPPQTFLARGSAITLKALNPGVDFSRYRYSPDVVSFVVPDDWLLTQVDRFYFTS